MAGGGRKGLLEKSFLKRLFWFYRSHRFFGKSVFKKAGVFYCQNFGIAGFCQLRFIHYFVKYSKVKKHSAPISQIFFCRSLAVYLRVPCKIYKKPAHKIIGRPFCPIDGSYILLHKFFCCRLFVHFSVADSRQHCVLVGLRCLCKCFYKRSAGIFPIAFFPK